jgi:hypothetical protein
MFCFGMIIFTPEDFLDYLLNESKNMVTYSLNWGKEKLKTMSDKNNHKNQNDSDKTVETETLVSASAVPVQETGTGKSRNIFYLTDEKKTSVRRHMSVVNHSSTLREPITLSNDLTPAGHERSAFLMSQTWNSTKSLKSFSDDANDDSSPLITNRSSSLSTSDFSDDLPWSTRWCEAWKVSIEFYYLCRFCHGIYECFV